MTTLTLDKPELIDRLERIAVDHQTTPAALLDTAVVEFLKRMEQQEALPTKAHSARSPQFLREVEAFERLKPELLQQYKGRVVAIYQGQVVAVGDDVLAVHNSVIEKYGSVPCYVEWVEEQTPRRVRTVSAWRSR